MLLDAASTPASSCRPTKQLTHTPAVCSALPAVLLPLEHYRHVAVIYIALCTFAFLIYAAPSSSTPLGSISKVRYWCVAGCWGLELHDSLTPRLAGNAATA